MSEFKKSGKICMVTLGAVLLVCLMSFTSMEMVSDESDAVSIRVNQTVTLSEPDSDGDWEYCGEINVTVNGQMVKPNGGNIYGVDPTQINTPFQFVSKSGSNLTFRFTSPGIYDIDWIGFYPDAGEYTVMSTDTVYVSAEDGGSYTWYVGQNPNTSYDVYGWTPTSYTGSIPGVTVSLSTDEDYGIVDFSGAPTQTGNYTIVVTGGTDVGQYVVVFHATVKNPTFTHTVRYDKNGGTGSMSNSVVTNSVNGNSNVTLKSCSFTKSGYNFAGWKIGDTIYQPGQTVSVGANATVYAIAQWEANTLTLETVAKQYAVAGKSVSFNASATSNPSGATITFAKSNASSGLNVSISGNVVTCSAANAGTYTFTLTAIASGYTSSSTTVTVQVVPVLAFTNSPSAGALNA